MFRIALIIILSTPFAAHAIPVTWNFSGIITETQNNAFNGANEFPGVNVGDTFTGHVRFDTENFSDQGGFPAETARYDFDQAAPFGMSMDVSFGAYNLSTDTSLGFAGPFNSNSYSNIFIGNNWSVGSTVRDQLNLFSQTVLPSGNFSGAYIDGNPSAAAFMELAFLTTTDLSAISSLDIPLTPPDLSVMENRLFQVLGGFPNVFVRGEVLTLTLPTALKVSEPRTSFLILVGILVIIVVGERNIRLVKPVSYHVQDRNNT